MSKNNLEKKISVIGLGQMGKKIAELLIQKDYEVTVWNRSEEKTNRIKAVSKIAKCVEEAVAQNTIIIICVLDNQAVTQILKEVSDKKVFSSKTFINFTTGTPAEVKKLELWLNGLGAAYLNGAIQVAPDQMGLPDTTILLGGHRETYTDCKEVLDVLGGNTKYLGEHASASPAMDMATLSWVYGSYVGLMYGVALCQAEDIKLEDYSAIVGEIAPSFLEFYKYEINTVRENNFNVSQSPLSISVGASQRIADTVKSTGLATEFTDVIASILRKAKDRGFEHEEVSAIIKVIKAKE